MSSIAGCVKVPPDLLRPVPTYARRIDRLSVSGFERLDWVQTGSAFVSGSGVVGAGVTGSLVPASDRSSVRYLLENSRCIDIVEEGSDAALRLEGASGGGRDLGVGHYVGAIVWALTLLPILGLPVPDHAQGWATARLYANGRPIKSYEARSPYPFWTTVYTVRSDDEAAVAIARARAVRDVVTQVTADLCGTTPVALPGSSEGATSP